MPAGNGPPGTTRVVDVSFTCVSSRVATTVRNARRLRPKFVCGSLVSAIVCGQPGTTYARPTPLLSPETGRSWDASFEKTLKLSSGLNWYATIGKSLVTL